MPSNVHKDTVGTKNFSLQWTQPINVVYVRDYRVVAKPIDTTYPDPPPQNATEPPILVKGLQPGTQYGVTVSSVIHYERRVEYAHAAEIKIYTKPETVKSLNEGQSNLTFPIITIAFRSVSTKFTSYTLNLEGYTGYNKTETAARNNAIGKTFYRAQFSGVVAGEYYNLTIITVSGTVKSEPFIQRIRIMTAQADSVNSFNKMALTSRSVSVSWKRPVKTNGDLFQYRLEVANRTCKQLIVFNCTECKRNTSMEASGNCEHTTVVHLSESDIKDSTHVVNYTITGLLPDTEYVVKIAAYNQEGRGMERSLSETTDEEASSEPTAFTANNKTSDTITLTWAPPEPRPGRTHYNIRVYEKNETTPVYNYIGTINITGYRHNMYTANNLSSAWEYKFYIQAFTQKGGSGNVSSDVVMTEESAPTEAVQYNVTRIPNVYSHIKLSWECPKKKDGRNGIIKSSTLIYQPNQTSTIYPKRRNETYKNMNNCKWEQAVEVTPEYSYRFTVFLQNTYPGSQSTIYQYIEAGPPDISDDSVNASTASDSQTSVTLNICGKCLRDDENGKVTETGLLVCVNPPCDAARERRSSTAFSYDEYTNWHASKNGNFKEQYRTTSDDWDQGQAGTDSFEYVVGKENCDLEPSTHFCNGLLPQGSNLQVTLFACTTAGCTEGSTVKVKTRVPDTTSFQYTRLIVGAAAAVVVFVIIVVLVKCFFGRRRNVGKSARRLSTQGIQIGNVIANKRPIRISEFGERVDDMHKDSNMQFSDEFEDIGTISPKHACAASETGGNKLRNRYVNILPFDHTRVKLRSLADDDEDDSDYINANYIPGYNSPREYIATQGPMTGTVADFWRMLWEQDVNIIIMLSDLLEKGKPKVDRYWPENINEPVQHGEIIVEMINYSPLNKYVIKIFKITKRDESRKVRHYFLPGWQDFGANLTSDDVISFVRDVRMTIKPTEKGPICVHCSAGVGRTGTYVSLDVFMQAIDEENFDKELDVFDFVMRMRENRSYMVQTEKQYIFIYDTIKELIIRKRKEIAERENIYQNSDNYPEENIYTNEGYEPGPEEMYMNV
ncbi:tyrosine-protein phosphatase 10D-like [Haliotis cracherodii]|uniref:tyrosine-protein phosphatase 10D-like n=1 Tax=Haliotis cracherodii TaxID=6455 RepID=UPI0039EA5202